MLCIFRVREDGTKYKKTTIPRQFTNGKKKEKDSRTLFLKQVGNKDAIKQLVFLICVCERIIISLETIQASSTFTGF